MRLEYTIHEYNTMALRQKASILENDAIFLDHDLSVGIIHTLFSYHNYFIEVVVEYESNELIEIIAFENGERLDKYLDQFQLAELL
ncbi:hypothetical protein CNR22_04475 [Sphingobacteriaceae bacterium]|nr:hypothetical protein CNR22_04475 [Sphingobacteriaceae bacterium]